MTPTQPKKQKHPTGATALMATALPEAHATASKPSVLDRGDATTATPVDPPSSVASSPAPTPATTPTGSTVSAASSTTSAAGSLGTSTTTSTASAAAPVSSATAADSSTSSAPSDIPVMGAPPNVVTPPVPAGFVPVPGVDLRGYRPLQAEVACIPDAIIELPTIANWTAIFGMTAPPSNELQNRLSVAMQWSAYLGPAQSWFEYVKSQEGMAWKDALMTLDSMKPAFQLASTYNPTLLKQYPALSRLLAAGKVVGKRAASTRSKNAKALAKKNAATVAALPSTSANTTTATSTAPQAASNKGGTS